MGTLTLTMASALRLGQSALRSSLTAPAFNARTAAFNGLRCYSSSKTQTLKERFAEQLPEKIEQIKKLRKDYGSKVVGEVTLDQVYGGARGIKSLVWEGSVLDSEEGQSQSARSFSQKPQVERSLCQKVFSGSS